MWQRPLRYPTVLAIRIAETAVTVDIFQSADRFRCLVVRGLRKEETAQGWLTSSGELLETLN